MPTNLETVVTNYLRARTAAQGTRDAYSSTLKKWEQWGKGVALDRIGRKEAWIKESRSLPGRFSVHNGAGWEQGDWNGDGMFDSADFVTAFVDGGYEQGTRMDVAAVPEPMGWLLSLIGVPVLPFRRRACRIT